MKMVLAQWFGGDISGFRDFAENFWEILFFSMLAFCGIFICKFLRDTFRV